MTKLRHALSPHRALTTIVARLGWPAAQRVTGRRERSIRKWGEPDVGPGVPIEAALALDIAYLEATGGAIAPFEAWYNVQLQLARARTLAEVEDQAERLAAAHREVGEAFAARAMAAHALAGPRERANADRETEEAIVALAQTCTTLSFGAAF
jgi:hypothetical protein